MEPWLVLTALAISVALTGIVAFRAGRAAQAPGPPAAEMLARLEEVSAGLDALTRKLAEQQRDLAEEATALRTLIDAHLDAALDGAALPAPAAAPRAFRAAAG
jgi:hypothetical protein